jgi:hypothetical protein
MERIAIRPLNATDPRDKVYWILGLAPRIPHLGIVPDYSRETPAVYRDLARALIGHGEPSILAWCLQPKQLQAC